MKPYLLFVCLVMASFGCHRSHTVDAADFRESMVRHGFDVGPLATAMPADLQSINAGGRKNSQCAPAKIEGYAMDLCVWRYASSTDAGKWMADHAMDTAVPAGTSMHSYGDLIVLVAPANGVLPAPIRERVRASVFGVH